MATQSGFAYDESCVAATSASLATSQFLAVAITTGALFNGRTPIVLCVSSTNGTNGAVGVLQDTPAAGVVGLVRFDGITKMVASTSAGVYQGALITTNGSGQAMVADATGQLVIGRCVSSATTAAQVAGSLVEVLLRGPFTWFA